MHGMNYLQSAEVILKSLLLDLAQVVWNSFYGQIFIALRPAHSGGYVAGTNSLVWSTLDARCRDNTEAGAQEAN